ncbi:MAG: hypothetical protein BWY88_00457 [Synergistetes bacterium ADurb.Bin520]|nr:MAG: hypothetical protein BWY88_00457 [Synergistetes bacterium ADurb.Bin520]
MSFLGKIVSTLLGLFLLVVAPLGATGDFPAPGREELIERPAAGVIVGRHVNLRDRPSTEGKILGRWEDGEQEELVVVDAARGEDGQTWYQVLSERRGEGWVHGRFLRFEGVDDPLGRFCMMLRRDFGTEPSMTERRLGKPEGVDYRTLRPEDHPGEVTAVELRYSGGRVVFWITEEGPFLTEVDFEGGVSFGPISFGDAPGKVERLLGAPHGVDRSTWTYHSGMRRVIIGFSFDPEGDPGVNRMIFERDPY